MKDTKLYKIEIGCTDSKAGDVLNWRSANVIAKTAAEAIRKPKLSGREYVVQATMISVVDVQ